MELIHPGHKLLFSPYALSNLVAGCGYEIEEMLVYEQPYVFRSTKEGGVMLALGRLLLAVTDRVLRYTLAAWRPFFKEGLILVARPGKQGAQSRQSAQQGGP